MRWRWIRLLRWLGLRPQPHGAGQVIDMAAALRSIEPDFSEYQTLLWTAMNQRLDGTKLINNAIRITWLEDVQFPRVVGDLWGDWRWVG